MTQDTLIVGPSDNFAYDANANRTSDAAGSLGYSANSNKLTTAHGATLTHDASGNLTNDGQGKTYSHNNQGRIYQVFDSGSLKATYTHNPAGQVISITDARNITVSYSYDALGRITKADYPGTIEDITYSYDTCTNGKTRLCGTVDQSGTTAYQYDAYGNITKTTKAINSVNYVTRYAYDNRDQITTITYPDNRTVTYTRDHLSRITQVTSTLNGVLTTLLSNRSYRADGLPTAQTFGNGVAETRTYDLQGRLTQTTGVGPGVTYSYDANSNVTQVQNGGHNPQYVFDAKDRVTGDASVLAQITYAYDANANRSSITTDGNTKAYQYNPNSNQLIQVKNKATTLDAAGNTTSTNNGKWTYTYNNQGRLFKVYKQGQLKATYVYNAQGQRSRKDRVKNDGSTVTRIYHYDLRGHLLAETTLNGKPRKDYVWINTTPVAQIKTRKPNSGLTDKAIYYLHTDHLNTPRSATDTTQAVVWSWNSDAFGKQKPNPDPDLDTTKVRINLRFPGQYYDKESKLFYNWNRYYSPKLGRYITSDPIGLEGGLNTYGYVGGNPLSFVDTFGLKDIYFYEYGTGSSPTEKLAVVHVVDDKRKIVGVFTCASTFPDDMMKFATIQSGSYPFKIIKNRRGLVPWIYGNVPIMSHVNPNQKSDSAQGKAFLGTANEILVHRSYNKIRTPDGKLVPGKGSNACLTICGRQFKQFQKLFKLNETGMITIMRERFGDSRL